MKFSILEDGPTGTRVGEPVTAYLEWGGEMIGAEWPGAGIPVEPGRTYFLKVERADGAGVYLFATDANPYAEGMAFTGTTPHPGWDLLATIRGQTPAINVKLGTLTGVVQDVGNTPLVGARVRSEAGGVTTSGADGRYSLSLSEGAHGVSASLDGYVSSSQTAIAILEGQTQVLDFTLEAEDAPPPPPPPPPGGALVNGDFSRGLEGWNVWTERGELGPVAANGVVHLVGRGHNGGIYQQFQTGGAGAEVTVEGFWESRPSVANAQWAEVLVIDGARLPSDGNDLSAAEADVVMIYKNDTWATPNGWSGNMRNHAPVASVGSFVASSDVATIVLKSGNLLGVDSGVVFDDIEVGTPASPPPVNQPPIARLVATPSDGNVPLDVSFDASSSSDPDGDGLSFDWNFGDGASGTGETSSHRYDNAGLYTVVVTVDDGWGGTDAASTTVDVGLAAPVDNLVANGDFSLGLEGWSFWRERGAVTPVVEGGQAQRRSLPTVRDGRRGPRDHGGRVLGFRAHRRGIAVGGDSRDRWSGLTYRGSGFEWSPAERDSVTQARHVGFAVGMERGDGAGELRLIGGRGDDRAQERQRSGGEYWNDLRRHRRSRRELDPAPRRLTARHCRLGPTPDEPWPRGGPSGRARGHVVLEARERGIRKRW